MPHPRCFVSVQALRALAAILVVVFHLAIVEGRFGAGPAILPDFTRFADGGVDLFFVISGFVMTTIASGSYGSRANAGRFLARRTWRILPLYWFYTTLVVLLMIVAPGIANSAYADQDILASYLLWPQAELPVLTVGWTLIHEMYFYLVMAALIAMGRERAVPGALLAWALAVAAGWASGPGEPLSMLVASPMTLEFIAGAFIGLYWRRVPRQYGIACLVLGTAAFTLAMPALELAGATANGPLLRTLVFGSSGALVVLGAVTAEAAACIRVPRCLSAIGDSSYSLYLSHVFVISAAGRAWAWSGLNQAWWQHAGFLALAVVACIAAGLVSHRLLEQPLLRLGGHLFRRRRHRVAEPDTAAPVLQPD